MIRRFLENGVTWLLMAGALMAVGCGADGGFGVNWGPPYPGPFPPVPVPTIQAPFHTAVFLGQDHRIYALYRDANGTIVEGGTWSFVSSEINITPTFTTGIFDAASGGLPLDISFTQSGWYTFRFSQSNINILTSVYVYPAPDPDVTINIGEPVTINGLTTSYPNQSTKVESGPLGISSVNEATISFTPTETGTFPVAYEVWGIPQSQWAVIATYSRNITVIDSNPPPAGTVVSAGADQVIAIGETVVLSGTAQVGATYSEGDWFSVSGPTSATADQLFYDAGTQSTPLEFTASEAGTYAFEFTDGTYSDFVTINVSP